MLGRRFDSLVLPEVPAFSLTAGSFGNEGSSSVSRSANWRSNSAWLETPITRYVRRA